MVEMLIIFVCMIYLDIIDKLYMQDSILKHEQIESLLGNSIDKEYTSIVTSIHSISWSLSMHIPIIISMVLGKYSECNCTSIFIFIKLLISLILNGVAHYMINIAENNKLIADTDIIHFIQILATLIYWFIIC